jgi:lipoate-protein ligase A
LHLFFKELMSQVVRLIVGPPADGAWNMSVDRALLETAASEGRATLRFYRWAPATISLGYFQPLQSRGNHPPSRNCPVVRRATGGGAIVHDRELTYSLALPASNPWSRDHLGLVEMIHGSLIRCLGELGVADMELWGKRSNGDDSQESAEPFLCFQRRVPVDVVLAGAKVIGSAQRRWRDALLQHGSVLLDRSPAAPELPGVAQLADGPRPDFRALSNAWPPILQQQTGWRLEPGELSKAEISRAEAIRLEWFGNDAWTHKR